MKNSRVLLSVFLVVWGIMSLFVNDLNAKYFLLQNAVIEGLVKKGTFSLVDQILPGFNLVEGDETFRYGGKVYPMKQPGQAVLGAILYTPLQALGIEWIHHYDYASNLVTMFSSGIFVAAGALSIYLVGGILAPIILISTIIWPYAGVSHHDIYAMATVTIAIILAYKQKYTSSGIMAALTLFFSMLPLTMPFGIGLCIWLSARRYRDLYYYVKGLVVGLVPSLLFNTLVFGNPLLFPNLAGKVADTIPLWDILNILKHLYFYLISPTSSLLAFSPVLVFALWGYPELKKKSLLLSKALIIVPILLLVHVSSQETYGGYQYGPRYLLPIIPLLSLATGMAWRKLNGWGKKLFVVMWTYSFVVALIGAMTTVMYEMPNTPYAPYAQLMKIVNDGLPSYRLLPIGVGLILIAAFALLDRAFKKDNPVLGLD